MQCFSAEDMIEPGTTAAPAAKATDESGAYVWAFPGAPIRIAIDLAGIAAVNQQIASAGEDASVWGLLYGSAQGEGVHIRSMGRLSSGGTDEFARVLSANAQPREPTAVGYYVAGPRNAIKLESAEIELAQRYFKPPYSVVLCVQTGQEPVPKASFFFWEDGEFLGDFAFLQFPFDVESLQKEIARGPRKVETHSPRDVMRSPAPTRIESRRAAAPAWMTRVLAVCALFLVLAGLVVIWSKSSGLLTRTRSSETASDVGLRAERAGLDFRVTWDRRSEAVRKAGQGVLTIRDGASNRALILSPDDLKSSSILLQAQSDRMQIRLSLVAPDRSERAESVLFLRAESAANDRPPLPQTGKVSGSRPPASAGAISLSPPASMAAGNSASPAPVDLAAIPITRADAGLIDTVRSYLKSEANVLVRVKLDERGSVTRTQIVLPPGLSPFVVAALERAAYRWKFKPAERNGRPVPSESAVVLRLEP